MNTPTITIRDGIFLQYFPAPVIKQVQDKLTVDNEVYHMLRRKKGGHVWGIPPQFSFYTMYGNVMKIPRGMEDSLLKYLEKISLEYKLERRTISKKLSFTPKEIAMEGEYAFQKRLVESAVLAEKGLFVSGTGTGKCHEKNTKILMYDGSLKKVEDIRIGDLVMGDDSTPRKVLNTCEGVSRGYRIVPRKGEPFVVKHDHRLSLKHTVTKKIINITVDEYLEQTKKFKHEYKLYRMPVEFSEKDTLLEPYFLGLWLADGTQKTSQITNPDKEVWDYLTEYANTLGLKFTKYKHNNRCETLNITRGGDVLKTSMIEMLRVEGVVQKKHIPQNYLVNSRKKRLELLAGLLDGDGHMTTGGFDWISKSEQIADQIVFLCRSLGLAAYKKKCLKGIKSAKFLGVYYRVSISGDCSVIPNKIKRKKAPKRRQIKSVLVTGVRVEPVEHLIEYAGFELDGNHLYIQGDFIISHNTVMSAELIRRIGKTTTILVPKLTLAEQFRLEMKTHWDYDCGMISGKEKTIKDITVATYQSLSNNPELLRKLVMNTSVLICDEAQGCVSPSAMKVFNSFCPDHFFGLTASPDRDDSLAAGVYFLFGEEPIVEYHKTQLSPLVQVYQSGAHIAPSFEYHEMIDEMVEHERRNNLIAGLIGGSAFEGRKVLVLTKRIAHYDMFREKFPASQAFRYIESSDKDRDKTLMRMKKGLEPFSVIFGTTSLLSVGVDIPELDTVILACDMKGKVLTTQSVGRILRSFSDKKQPIIIDLHDGFKWNYDMYMKDQEPVITNHTLNRQFRARLDLYDHKGWEVEYKGGMLPKSWRK